MCTAVTILGLLLALTGVLVLLRLAPRGREIREVGSKARQSWLVPVGWVALFAGFGLQLVAGPSLPVMLSTPLL
jgi:hypothetical protein